MKKVPLYFRISVLSALNITKSMSNIKVFNANMKVSNAEISRIGKGNIWLPSFYQINFSDVLECDMLKKLCVAFYICIYHEKYVYTTTFHMYSNLM